MSNPFLILDYAMVRRDAIRGVRKDWGGITVIVDGGSDLTVDIDGFSGHRSVINQVYTSLSQWLRAEEAGDYAINYDFKGANRE